MAGSRRDTALHDTIVHSTIVQCALYNSAPMAVQATSKIVFFFIELFLTAGRNALAH